MTAQSRADEQIEGYLAARQRRLAAASRSRKSEKRKKSLAFVEAAVIQAVEEPTSDPEFERALKIVAHSVKSMLSPRALGYLEGTLNSDERAGAIRWRELARLDLWLSRAAIPVGKNARALVRQTGFTASSLYRLRDAQDHPVKLFSVSGRAPGRTVAAIYKIAKRAQVSPNTVVAALLNFGLERLADALRATHTVPATLPDDIPRAT